MNWFNARLSERSSQAALAQLLAIWAGVGAGVLSGASTASTNMLLAGAITATVPCLVAIFLPEAGTPVAGTKPDIIAMPENAEKDNSNA